MSKCKIEINAVPVDHRYVNSPMTSQGRCLTHDWTFAMGEPMWGGKECPLGRIEQATDAALAKIDEAISKRK